MIIDIQVDIDEAGIVRIDGTKYVPEYTKSYTKPEHANSEVIEIKEVRPIYGDSFSWLQLLFDMPKMQFSPGDKIRIIKE